MLCPNFRSWLEAGLDHSRLWFHIRRKPPAPLLSGTTAGVQMLAVKSGPQVDEYQKITKYCFILTQSGLHQKTVNPQKAKRSLQTQSKMINNLQITQIKYSLSSFGGHQIWPIWSFRSSLVKEETQPCSLTLLHHVIWQMTVIAEVFFFLF